MWQRFRFPVILAMLVTGLNALKPAVVDDSAYLLLAQNIASHPTDPYGGTLFWYVEPQPSMEILAPIVLPAWLAFGIVLFGNNLVLLKLFLFPFLLILSCSIQSLAKSFVPRASSWLPTLIMFSPFVLPLINVMLDIPAVALSLLSISIFIRNNTEIKHLLLAGLIAGVAMQTKYTAFAAPATIVWYGFTHKRLLASLLTAMVAACVFIGWEYFLYHKYGTSHFVYHAFGPGASDVSWGTKIILLKAHLKYAGGLGIGLSLLAMNGLGAKQWFSYVVILMLTVSMALVCCLTYSQSILSIKDNGVVGMDVSGVFFQTIGIVWLATLGVGVFKITRRGASRTTLFLVGWFAIECLSTFGLTPFPAARRIIGIEFPATFLLFRSVEVWSRAHRIPYLRPAYAFALSLGFLLFALDLWDAQPEARLAQQSARFIRTQEPTPRIWYLGHWGFQYACETEGMKPLVPGQTEVLPGDWLVVPEYPDEFGFYRPYHSGARPVWVKENVLEMTRFTWQDKLSATTIPTLYGGTVPIVGRDHPRLTVVVFRVLKPWDVKRLKSP